MKPMLAAIIVVTAAAILLSADPIAFLRDPPEGMWFVHSSGVAHTYCVDGNLIAVVARTGETIDHQERCD